MSQRDLSVVGHWRVDGRNYGKTSRCWLENMDASISTIKPLFQETYGKEVRALKIPVVTRSNVVRKQTSGLYDGDCSSSQ